MSARICLITPGHLSTNPRIIKEADALVDAGHAVEVVAADFTLWARAADRGFSGRRWGVSKTIRFGPHAPPAARTRQVVRQQIARSAIKVGLELDSIASAACHPIGPDLTSAALSVRADLYIAHYIAALPAAARAAGRYGAIYAFDAEDFHLGDLPNDPQHDFEKKLIRSVEARYLAGCAYVTAASPGIADAYVETYGIQRPKVVLNVFPKSQAPERPTNKGTKLPWPSVYWFSQTVGPNRGLECAVRAIRRARSKPHLYLRGTLAAGFGDRLKALAQNECVSDHLHFLPPADPQALERLASVFDVGLSAEPGYSQNNCLALGNKLFSYILAGLPTAMSDVSAHRAFAKNTSEAVKLYPAGDADGLAEVLDCWFAKPAALAEARAAAWNLGQNRFNWDIEQLGFLMEVSNALRKRD